MSAVKIIRMFQRYILSTLLIVMGVVIVASSIELVILVVQELLTPRFSWILVSSPGSAVSS